MYVYVYSNFLEGTCAGSRLEEDGARWLSLVAIETETVFLEFYTSDDR